MCFVNFIVIMHIVIKVETMLWVHLVFKFSILAPEEKIYDSRKKCQILGTGAIKQKSTLFLKLLQNCTGRNGTWRVREHFRQTVVIMCILDVIV